MTNEEIKHNFATNIIKLRKHRKMNQTEFGELIHYSYKNISKWENEETLPDIETMTNIAKTFNVKIDDLISEGDIIHASNKKHNHLIITISSLMLPYIIALIIFTVLNVMSIPYSYYSFIGASIISAITSITLTSIFYDKKWLCLSIIYLVLSTALLVMFLVNFAMFYLIIIIALVISIALAIFFKIEFKR